MSAIAFQNAVDWARRNGLLTFPAASLRRGKPASPVDEKRRVYNRNYQRRYRARPGFRDYNRDYMRRYRAGNTIL